MFDNRTRSLITSAPELDDLDVDRLPEELTQFFVEITAARLSLAAVPDNERRDLQQRLARLRRLANTYASYVAANVAPDHTRSAAFVAATGLRLLGEAGILSLELPPLAERLSINAVSPWIVSIILFMIAESPADASSTVTAMREYATFDDSASATTLREAIACFAEGRLEGVLDITSDCLARRAAPAPEDADSFETAVDLMWLRLAEGLAGVAARLLSRNPADLGAELEPSAAFQQVRDTAYQRIELAMPSSDDPTVIVEKQVVSMFAGPHLLASLLLRLGDDFFRRGLIFTPSPAGIDDVAWQESLEALARTRPFLWTNHIDAIEQGYLNLGVSSAISFPTGAGKSTLAELKICTHVLAGNKVVFTAPTHALVNQVRTALSQSFPDCSVHDSVIGDGYYAEVDEEGSAALADITVMTPERCLMLLDLYPTAFQEVGLFVLDECHILHPSRGADDRRSLDAMLCLLRMLDVSNELDILLLSAMMANSKELADWLSHVLGRTCLSLAFEWKPTRQARGALVFDKHALDRLRKKSQRAKRERKTMHPPVALKRALDIHPFGLFCLRQNWQTNEVTDYRSCLLSSETIPIDCNKQWQLVTGKNNVAALLAAAFGRLGIKTIVFSQNKAHCESIAKKLEVVLAETEHPLELNNEEDELVKAAIEEAGAREHAYLPSTHGSVCHHGLLNAVERELAERVFRRKDGANVIIATPTLAQGMNLPAQAVILAGTFRFDPETQRHELLAAHELLNAAGRAGRAGHRAEGIVLIIPDRPIGFDAERGSIDDDWFMLKESIFAQTDQCLTINDPLELMLDRLQLLGMDARGTPVYFLNRIPVDVDENNVPSDAPARRIFDRSLASYRARKNDESAAFDAKVNGALELRRRILLDPDTVSWLDRLAGANGVSVGLISSLHMLLVDEENLSDVRVSGWLDRILDWLIENPVISFRMLNYEGLQQILGNAKSHGYGENTDAHAAVINRLRPLVKLWIEGATLSQIEHACPTKRRVSNKKRQGAAEAPRQPAALGFCKRARVLSQRVTLDLSVVAGLVPQIWRSHLEQLGESDPTIPITMGTASACIRRGFQNPEQLAVAGQLRSIEGFPGQITRRHVHEFHERIKSHIAPGSGTETFADIKTRISKAIEIVSAGDSPAEL